MRSLRNLGGLLVLFVAGEAFAQTPEELRTQAQAAARKQDWKTAIQAMTRLIELKPEDPANHLGRGQFHELAGTFDAAVADFRRAIELDPRNARSYFSLGSAAFKQGKIAESIAAFDKQIELDPKAKVSHWQRGISYYYAGRWDDGVAQFEGYQSFDSNDVENAVWRFMCMARKDSIAKAEKEMLKIGDDKRVPMRQVYDLYAGKLKPDDVLAAAKVGEPSKEQLNRQLFYAHLYVGIYQELLGNKKLALEHLHKATEEHKIGHYMWDVARVHRDLLKK